MSIIGTRSGNPLPGRLLDLNNSYSVVERGVPFSITEDLVVVPPMSSVMTLGLPQLVASCAAAIAPAAGPDSSI